MVPVFIQKNLFHVTIQLEKSGLKEQKINSM